MVRPITFWPQDHILNMTKEAIEARLVELEKAINQTLANYNVLMGGKQECEYWLRILGEQDRKPDESI